MSKVKIEIKIPETLDDIPLWKYQEYMKVVESNKGDENAADFLNKKALQIFCGVALTETMNVPLTTFMFALQHLKSLFDSETPLVRNFRFRDPEGEEQIMGFIPNLEKMTFGEYVDIDKYISDWSTMHLAMAVLYRPARYGSGEKYLIEDYKGTEVYGEAMKQTPVSVALGAMLFFYRLGTKLLGATTSYLQKQPELYEKFKAHLPADGDGILHLLRLQMDTTLESIRRQRFHSVKP